MLLYISGQSGDGICFYRMDGWEAQLVPQVHGSIICKPVIWIHGCAWFLPLVRSNIFQEKAFQQPYPFWPGSTFVSSLWCEFFVLLRVWVLIIFIFALFFLFFFNLYSFSQFKVHRNGGWQRINFERAADAQLIQKADGSDGFLANPWIQHFRPGCNPHVVASTDVRKNGASTSQATCYSKQIPACDSHLCHHNLVGSDTGAISLLFAW